MKKSVDSYVKELSYIRAGRANPDILNRITADYYGCPTPVPQMAQVSMPDARTLAIQPWDASTVKLIDQSAFEGCENLKKVTFYDVEEEKDIFADETEDVESNVSVEPTLIISACAFQNCTALESINLPKTLHTLQTYAFSGCTSLKTVIIPKGTIMIANSVFDAGSPKIYVYEDSQPQGWASNWVSGTATVSYGYNGEDISVPDNEATD